MRNLMNIVSINDFIEKHNKGTFGVYAVTITEPKLKGGKKCPYLGKVLKATFIKNAILGISYMGAVNGVARRENIENFQFEEGKLPWGVWKNYPYTIEHKGAEYLRLFQNSQTKMISVYFIDGKEVDKSSEEFKDLELYLPSKTASKKQMECGIKEEETVTPLTYKYDSICYLQQKDNMYIKNVGIAVEPQWIKEMFKKA